MKIARLETLYCDAGWRPWIFLKATTDDGAVGWAEITDSHGSPHGLAGIVEDLEPLVALRKIQGRQPASQNSVSSRAIFIRRQDTDAPRARRSAASQRRC